MIPIAAHEDPAWRLDAFVYYWSASLDGDLSVDGQDVELDRGDGVSGDASLSGFLGHFEAGRGPWSFAIAPMFVRVESDGDASAGVDADVEIDAQVHDGFVARQIAGPWQWLAGARYCEVEAEVDLTPGGAPDAIAAWVDPIVGVRYVGDLGERVSLRARADVGGFGVGSDFAWNASALLGYRFSPGFSAHLGYRALSVDFDEGSAGDRVAYDLSLYGPILGVALSF